MELAEKQMESRLVYDGIIVKVHMDLAQLPDGRRAHREVVSHPGGVGILPLDDEGNIIMVRQFRYPFHQELLEIPAGKLEPGEDPEQCAIRELSEEIGTTAGELLSLGTIYPSPGVYGETLHLYLARRLTFGAPHPDEGEFLQVERIAFAQAVDMLLSNTLRDGKTVCAIWMTKALLNL